MATPTLVLINDGGLTDGVIDAADVNTNWTNLTTADTDTKVEGTGSMSGVCRNDGEDSYCDVGGAPVTAVGKVLRGWVNTTNLAYMQAEATNPYELWCYDGTSQSNGLALFGSDTYPGGWFYYWQDMDDFTGVTLANIDRWGIEAGHSTAAKNVVNMWMDALRYMDGYYLTGGTSGDKVGIADVYGVDATAGYGIFQTFGGVYFCTGEVQIGNGATTTYFEMDGDLLIYRDMPGALTISAGLYTLSAEGTGCDCLIKNSVIRSEGTGSTVRFVVDLSDTDATIEFTDNLIVNGSTITFATGQTATGNIYDNCGQITAAGADLTGSIVKNYEGTADTAALVYNVSGDPDGELDDMEFTMGIASTHAIELGTSSATTVTLRGWTVSGYNASNGQTNSTIYLPDRGTDTTWTINVIGGTGNFSYKAVRGTDTVTLNINPVPITINVQDRSTDPIQNAQCSIYLSSDDTELMNADTTALGVATVTLPGSWPADVYWRVRKGSTGTTKYYKQSGLGTVSTTGFEITVTLEENTINSS